MESISRVDLRAALCSSTVKPNGSLSVHRRLLRPKSAEGTIRPLGERDLFPEERRIHELQQQYEARLAQLNADWQKRFGQCVKKLTPLALKNATLQSRVKQHTQRWLSHPQVANNTVLCAPW